MSSFVYEARDGFSRVARVNNETGDFVLASEQECTDLIRNNRALAEIQAQGRGKETFRLVARVPVPFVEKMMIEGSFHDENHWRSWLNDGDNRDFRVWEGRI